MNNANERVEREMSRYEQGIVDTCFEEGQYQDGISTLDQLRSPNYKPSPGHIRQCLFLVLYPNPPSNLDKGKGRVNSVHLSPRKQQKSHFAPTPAVRDAAMRVLTSFAITNTPSSLLCALPHYPAGGQTDGSGISDWAGDDEDSFLAREAMSIKGVKNCWAILKGGFIQRKSLIMMSPKKGKRRRRDSLEQEEAFTGEEMEPPSLVSENGWPVLIWLIGLFEKDEILTEGKGLPRYSPLLLSQIPAPRSGMRWEADAPLDIIFHCLNQKEQRRRNAGSRLLTSLINLTSTTYFNLHMFLAAVFGRLSHFTQEQFSELFSDMPVSATVLKFKIALCRQFIAKHVPAGALRAQPSVPTIRAQPKALRASASRNDVETAGSKNVSSENPSSPSIARKIPAPSCAEIIDVLRNKSRNASSMHYKFEILVCYSNLPSEDQDARWRELLGDAGLIESAFVSDGDADAATFYKNVWNNTVRAL